MQTFFKLALEGEAFRNESASSLKRNFFMITTPNPYLQLFFDFLRRNGSAGSVYLLTYETDDYTVLQYGSNGKYQQNEEFLDALPRQILYNQVAEKWWQLLVQQGLIEPMPSESSAGRMQPSTTNKAALRRAKFEANEEQALYCYLEQQLMGACPTVIRCCHQLNELSQIAHAFTKALNDRTEQAVENDLAEFNWGPLSKAALLNVQHRGIAIGTHVDYTFTDGLVVSNVQESHRRPFEFAGVWIELPDSKTKKLPVHFGFTDSRKQSVSALDMVQGQQLTTQWCLEHDYKQLALDPQLRQVVEAYGLVNTMQPTQYWLSAGHLLVDLMLYHKNTLQRINEDSLDSLRAKGLPACGDDDYELPF